MYNPLLLALSLFLATALTYALAGDEVDCERAKTTQDAEQCSRQELAASEAVLDEYLAAASERYRDEELILTGLDGAQKSWLTYRRDHCRATFALWVGGSIRGVMMNHCLLQQTRQRTWDVWHTYLTFMDSTPPLLPEPQR